MKSVSETFNAKLLTHGPTYKNLGVDEIVAVSGLQTFKKGTLDTFIEENPKIDTERISKIHKQSTKRGHASMTTTPSFYFEVEGSRLIDMYGTALPFGSYIFFSSRRIKITKDTLVRPNNLPENMWNSYEGLLNEYSQRWANGENDKARRTLPIGFYSHGIMKYSIEDILHLIKSAEDEGVPKEIELMGKAMGDAVKEKAPSLYNAAIERPVSLSYGHPTPFHVKKYSQFKKEESKIDSWTSDFLSEEVTNFNSGKREIDTWKEFAMRTSDMVMVNAVFPMTLTIWNDLKRHRTTLQKAESIYTAVNRATDELNSLKQGETAKWVHIPPGASENYLPVVHNALMEYQKLSDNFDKEDVIYVAPQCVKLMASISMNGFHLFDPYGLIGVRTCTTADYEISEWATKLSNQIEKEIPILKGLLGPKCKTGFCPERKPCGVVNKYRQE